MAQPQRVLVPMSSHADMGTSGIKTGSWFEEVATPYYEFLDAGFQVVFASPNGGAAPIDHLSMQPPFTTANTDRFLDDPVGMRAVADTASLHRLDVDAFDAVFFPGGYGLLWDLASDSYTIRLIERLRCSREAGGDGLPRAWHPARRQGPERRPAREGATGHGLHQRRG